jgi:hypothetical protein
MRRFSMLGAGSCWAVLAACGDTSSPEPTTDLVIDGDWYWEESVEDPKLGIQCFDSGILTVSQNGARFQATGHITGACSGPGGTVGIDDPIQVVSGVLSGSTISFSVDGCPYRGVAHGTAPAPDSATGTVTCTVTQSGVTAHLAGTWRLLQSPPDNQQPTVSGLVSGSSAPTGYSTYFLLRDTLRITIQAADDRGLIWVGYTMSGSASARDSLACTGTTATRTFTFEITPSMVGDLTISVFARDSGGNRTTVLLAPPPLTVLNLTAAVADSAILPGPVVDLAYDAKRDRIFISTAAAAQVLVIDRATGSAAAPLTLPGPGGSLDLSVGGDSLLVALTDRPTVAVVNLISGQTDTIHLDFDQGAFPHVAGALRVAANGLALVTATAPGYSGFGGQLATVNLATGVATTRSDVGFSGSLTLSTQLARLGDRSVVAVAQVDISPSTSYLYTAATDAFSGAIPTGSMFAPTVQGSATGRRFMYGQTLYDQNLVPLGTFAGPVGGTGAPPAISADATKVFVDGTPPGFPGFEVQSAASHAVLGATYVPGWAPNVNFMNRLTALPDNRTLLMYQAAWSWVAGATRLYIVHLP